MSQVTLLRALGETDLDMLLEWRNSEQVRRFMYSTGLIAPDQHRRWFEAIQEDSQRHPLVFERDGMPSGFVNIGPVQRGGIADWGFYTAPEAPRGTGKLLGHAALTHAFDVLGLHKVCGEALGFNEISQRFHLSLGFQREGVLVDQHFDGAAYHDVVRFGLTAAAWRAMTREDNYENE